MGELLLCFGHEGELTVRQRKTGFVGRNAVFIWTGRKYILCSHVCGTKQMEFELVIFQGRVGYGMKVTGCSAALTKCISDRSIKFFFF